MSIKKKLLASYFLVASLVFVTVGALIVIFDQRHVRRSTEESLNFYLSQVSQQYELRLNSLDNALTTILSNEEFVEQIRVLTFLENRDENLHLIERAYRRIDELMNSYTNLTSFYRVNIYNSHGDFLSTDPNLFSRINNPQEKLDEIRHFKSLKGTDSYIIANHTDIWGNGEENLFTYMQILNSSNGVTTYLEVQILQDDIEKIFGDYVQKGIYFYVFDAESQLIATSVGEEALPYELAQTFRMFNEEEVRSIQNNFLAVLYESSSTNTQIIGLQDLNMANRGNQLTVIVIISIGIILLLVIFVIFDVMLARILNPLETLKRDMERVELETLTNESSLDTTEDEIRSLSKSYDRLRKRLSGAVRNEMLAQRKHFEASMEVLQAQVNPHFIYNVMNIISYKGMELEDDDLIDISQGITNMLRYTTSNIEKIATLEAEIFHVQNYLMLMKKRYEDMLNFSFTCTGELESVAIPKLVLQVFAENSLKYGFSTGQPTLFVNITAEIVSPNSWRLVIQDDGPGFVENKRLELLEKINEISYRLSCKKSIDQIQFEIGGLGILNTYVRLKIYYGPEFSMKIENIVTGSRIIMERNEKDGL